MFSRWALAREEDLGFSRLLTTLTERQGRQRGQTLLDALRLPLLAEFAAALNDMTYPLQARPRSPRCIASLRAVAKS